MQVQPYLQFDGRCEEALEFYKSALGAKVEAIMRFKDGPDCMEMPQGTSDKVLHACFRIGESTIMASDGYCKGKPDFQGFSLTIQASDKAEADRLFKALEPGGAGADAARRDVLLAALRHGGRPFRRLVDDRHAHAGRGAETTPS